MRPPRRKPGPPPPHPPASGLGPRTRGRSPVPLPPQAKQVAEAPIDVEVERLSADGEGVASWKGRALFVPDTVPGEAVRVVPSVKGKVQRGKLLEVLRPAPERIVPGCPLAGVCGGCDWLHLDPAAQRRERGRAGPAALERLRGRAAPAAS